MARISIEEQRRALATHIEATDFFARLFIAAAFVLGLILGSLATWSLM